MKATLPQRKRLSSRPKTAIAASRPVRPEAWKQPGQRITIPFNQPTFRDRELDFMAEAVRNGHLSGDGPFTHKCHAWLESVLGVRKALLTTSCTDALELAALLLEIQPGDEVIVPSFTFVSTANAFVLRGARPVFADVRWDTLNLDETKLPQLFTERTRAIVPVHYAGVGCEMDRLMAAAAQNGISVVEDTAHGLLGRYRGQFLGTLGVLATVSFHETKNFTCGEGGALLINDDCFAERAEILREKGTNRARFFRGQTDKYTWVDLGSSFLPADILAAVLFAQFRASSQIQAKRRRLWQYYFNHLQDWAQAHGARLPIVPPHCEQAYHLFYLLLPTLESRDALIAHLKARGVLSVFHYLPLHLSDMGRRFGGRAGMCPVTERVSERIVRLPFFNDLTEPEQAQVVEAVQQFNP